MYINLNIYFKLKLYVILAFVVLLQHIKGEGANEKKFA